MNIDYSNILPGDDAPDADNPLNPRPQPLPQAAVPPPAPAQASAQPAAAAPARSTSANVVVLSADPVLIDLLRESLNGVHRVWRADDATHAADLMVASGNAVLLIDASLADHNTKDLVTHVHRSFRTSRSSSPAAATTSTSSRRSSPKA